MTEEEHRAAFTTALRGVPTSSVAIAFSTLTPGINWMGCSKGHMAEEYAKYKAGRPCVIRSRANNMRANDIDLTLLTMRARQRAAGKTDWTKITNP